MENGKQENINYTHIDVCFLLLSVYLFNIEFCTKSKNTYTFLHRKKNHNNSGYFPFVFTGLNTLNKEHNFQNI